MSERMNLERFGEKRDRVWQGPYIERRRGEIREALRGLGDDRLLSRVRGLIGIDSYSSLLDAYLYAMEGVRLERPGGDDLLDLAAHVLERLEISAQRSRLSDLYRDLFLERAGVANRAGKVCLAHWYLCLAREIDPKLPPVPRVTSSHTEQKPSGLSTVDEIEQTRLIGRTDEAMFLLESLLVPIDASPQSLSKIAWLRASLRVQMEGTEAAFRSAEGQVGKDSARADELWLWALASPSKKAPKWIERLAPSEEKLGRLVHFMNEDLPLLLRAESIGIALHHLGPMKALHLLLAWGATARWFARMKQPVLSAECRFQYESLSFSLSEGKCRDGLGLFDIAVAPSLKKIPTSPLSRWTAVSKMAGALAKVAMKGWITSPFLSQATLRKRTEKRQQLFAEIATEHADQLKGGWMKLAQFMSYMGPDIPEDAREVLGKLLQESSPVEGSVIRRTLESELGRDPELLFAKWDDRPFATGSVGQVHRARTHEGQEVVVKVQYPEIRRIIENDTKVLSFTIPLVRPMFRHWDFNSLLAEFRERLLEECDYEKEARNQESFRKFFSDDYEIVIPKVYRHLSTPRVLTSEYIPGKKWRDFVETAGQEEKNRAAEIMTRWHWASIFRFKSFSGDPHAGNFLFLPGRVAFVDYGNVKHWGGNACDGIRCVMDGLLNDDFALFSRGYDLAGMADSHGPVVKEEFSKIRQHILGYIREDKEIAFDYEKALLYFQTCTTANPNTRHTVKITPECMLLFKAHWSFFATVGQLSPKLNWRKIYLDAIR